MEILPSCSAGRTVSCLRLFSSLKIPPRGHLWNTFFSLWADRQASTLTQITLSHFQIESQWLSASDDLPCPGSTLPPPALGAASSVWSISGCEMSGMLLESTDGQGCCQALYKAWSSPQTKRRQVPKVSSAETLVYKFIFHRLHSDKAYFALTISIILTSCRCSLSTCWPAVPIHNRQYQGFAV